MMCMDGNKLAVRCTAEPPGIKCDVCDPNSLMQRLAITSIENPLRPPEVSECAGTSSVASGSMLRGLANAPQHTSMGFVPASSLISRGPGAHPTALQSSDALYDEGTSELTAFQTMMLNAMEDVHGTGTFGSSSDQYTTTSQPCTGSALQVDMPSSLSLPSGSRTFVARASIVNTSLSNRLATTAHLDRYMKVLKDKCPVHFGNGGRLSQQPTTCVQWSQPFQWTFMDLLSLASHSNASHIAFNAAFRNHEIEMERNQHAMRDFLTGKVKNVHSLASCSSPYFACGTILDFASY
ncbi:uncharacterized protein EDB93DRAFT_1254628 [Suillus bovinus]|uniref:uncharacterized protein n=1 Tax=Suillus bovinus TaxID=48563 RepID=UPI001B864751|nr:uncharacterized protein EDB93DRAFT_1254628 [Suillus bovinus]KAG2134203.1 hypothetical protein EDB93DRAFT_1254628 [Suillus bovinus]